MIMLKFRSREDREEILHKTKKMKKYVDEILDCLENCDYEDEYHERKYRHDDYDDEEEMHGRYGYMRRK